MSVVIAVVFLALGGLVKGATGAGAPVLAVPAMAMLYDVKLAVVIMMVPNLLTNIWQWWQYRKSLLGTRFVVLFASAAAVGTIFGTWLLATLPQEFLSLTLAAVVFVYVAFRFLRPGWVLSDSTALKLSMPVGVISGALQGASGISAPVSLSFLNAMRLERPTFIATVSVFFLMMTVTQIPALMALGIMTPALFGVSALALIPILAMMPVGARLAQRFSKDVFDRVMLAMLVLLALKLVFDALW